MVIDKQEMKESLRKLHLLYPKEKKVCLAGVSESLQDADGLSVLLWFRGCNFFCHNCQNPEVADLNWETGFTIGFDALQDYLLKYMDWIDWVVFTGGEPLLQPDAVKAIGHWAKEHKGKKLWLYTGFEKEELAEDILELFDVIKCGKYVQELKDDKLKFRGSSNQKLFKKVDNKWEQWNP